MNNTIKQFLDDGKITQKEYNVLFENKANYFSPVRDENKSKDQTSFRKFYAIFKKIIILQENNTKLDLSYIYFPFFDMELIKSNFDSLKTELIDFNHAHFFDMTSFMLREFDMKFIFHSTIFYDAHFQWTTFHKDISFIGAKFEHSAFFEGIQVNSLIDLSSTSFKKLALNGCHFNKLTANNLFGLKANKKAELSKDNFDNKETARIIKSHFEKQDNIIEANKYFAIEQELYINDLQNKNTKENNKTPILITLYLNKWVSNFGTNWIRALLFLFMLSYLFMRFYIDFDVFLGTNEKTIQHFTKPDDIRYVWAMFCAWFFLYLSTFFNTQQFKFWILIILGIFTGAISLSIYNHFLEISNYMVQLTNPINAFKNMNLYEGIEIYGALVRITIVTVIYQLIVAFRQNTRRK